MLSMPSAQSLTCVRVYTVSKFIKIITRVKVKLFLCPINEDVQERGVSHGQC
jgi:hypothetical protein